MDSSVEIVSRNLATTSNFVGFRGSWDFMFFRTWGVGWHMVRLGDATWHPKRVTLGKAM